MQYNIHAAKTNLSKLIEAVQRGEEVIIAKNDVPVAEIVPIKRKFKFGTMSHLKGTVPDFLEPMSEEELLDWEGRD
jgi:prevent-host-death family protein